MGRVAILAEALSPPGRLRRAGIRQKGCYVYSQCSPADDVILLPRHEFASAPSTQNDGRSGRSYRVAAVLCVLVVLVIVAQALHGTELRVPYFNALHVMVEQLSIAMSLLIALMAWFRTEGSSRHRVFAVGFLVAAVLDMLHVASYAGMPALITANDPHKAIVFWLAARFTIVLSVLATLVPVQQQRIATLGLLAYDIGVTVIGLLIPNRLPAFYVSGEGLTPLKVVLEWCITLSYFALAMYVARRRDHSLPNDKMAAGLLVLAIGELLFTQYREVDGLGNAAGHVAKIAGQVFLLLAVIEARLLRPYRQLDRAQHEHTAALERMNALFAGAPLGILVTDLSGRIVRSNRTAEELFRATPGQLTGLAIDALVPSELRHRHPGHREQYQQAARNITMSARPELEAQRLDGSRFYVSVALAPLEWDGKAHTLAFISDVSVQVAQVHKLKWLTQHDELTKLPNRCAIEQVLARQLDGGHGAVVALGLDALKRVNQVFGHEIGDKLLTAVGARIHAAMRPGEVLARLQGDTFVVILPGEHDGLVRARELLTAFQAPFSLTDDVVLHASATGGYVSYPDDGREPAQLLQNAELAMAAAKRTQRRGIAGFDAAQPMRAKRWLELASRLEDAKADGQFHLLYQPRVRLTDGTVAGFEALCRWHDGQHHISPVEFIPVAEETGYIVELGRWIADTALAQAGEWQRSGFAFGRIAINLSPRQLADGGLIAFLRDSLQRHGLAPSQLELEITETAAMENLDWALPQIRALAELGICIALDDFGTGYSSLSYLQSLPLSVLKIDAAFVRQLHSETGQSVARTVIALARSLGYSAVAEGVETEAQKAWLRAQGCDEMQGYLEARPLSVEQTQHYLQQRSAASAEPALE